MTRKILATLIAATFATTVLAATAPAAQAKDITWGVQHQARDITWG